MSGNIPKRCRPHCDFTKGGTVQIRMGAVAYDSGTGLQGGAVRL